MNAQKPPASQAFLESFEDANVFDCGDFNLIKVAQDAVLRKVGDTKHHTYFDKPAFLIKIWFGLKNLSRGKINIAPLPNNPKILAAVPLRTVEVPGHGVHNQFLGRILEFVPKSKLHLLQMSGKENKTVCPDITHDQVMYHMEYERLALWEMQFLKDLNACFIRVQAETRFEQQDLQHIRTGFDEFWRKFRAFRFYFSNFDFKKALLIPGYQSEHVIAALQSLHVEVIELQHGVITTASHFYCYPEKIQHVARRALFANQVWMFGSFWKKELLKGYEYEASQLHILGDYFVRSAQPPDDLRPLAAFEQKFKIRILVGTQKKRHEVFNDLVCMLSEKYSKLRPDVGIVVKRHPAESAELYSALRGLPNVLLAEANLDFLYPRCHAYISMYSNTLFEATRVALLKKFVLESPQTTEFVNGVVATGVAVRLLAGDDPLELDDDTPNLPSDAFFQPHINQELLNSLNFSN